MPVRYLYRSYDQATLAQLYRARRRRLVTPLRDGMNLVAKEFVAAQDAEQPGRPACCRSSPALRPSDDAAVLTNPYHADGMAADLDRALRMPLDERRERHARLLERGARPDAHELGGLVSRAARGREEMLPSCGGVPRKRGRLIGKHARFAWYGVC